MHLQIYLAIIQLSHTALASWQFGKRHLEKTRQTHHEGSRPQLYTVRVHSQ